MNKLKYLLSAFVLLCFASCKDDPWEDVADGGWNHERSIIDVKFEGQAGTPTITETDSETPALTEKERRKAERQAKREARRREKTQKNN